MVMWPLLPLVVEGLLPRALAASVAAGFAAFFGSGRSPFYGLLVLPAMGVYCRVKRAVCGPMTAPQGRCSHQEHTTRVNAASSAAKEPGPLRMFKATASNTFRPQQIGSREQSRARLDLSGFVHVLDVNTSELWCDIEASATFETFVAQTLPHGVAPLVVPELRTITVGGAIVGIGIESSSFKHGFFHEGLLEADVLLASGDVVTVSPTGEYAELFNAIPNSLGSFGYLLRLRMRVQRAQPLVNIQKTWFSTPEALIEGLELACKEPAWDYVDAVALSETGGMVITGKFVEKVPQGQVVKNYGLWPPFYPTLVQEGSEYLSTENYLWRWDADWFWVTQIFPGLSWRVVRWLCGPEMLRSDIYKIFNDFVIKNIAGPLKLTKNEELVIQDIDIPAEQSAQFLRQFLQVVPSARIGKIKLSRPGRTSPPTVPIWLCPVKGTASPLMPMNAGKLYINFGFWDALEGPETKGGNEAGTVNRALEQLCTKLGGKKTLYSSVYFSEEEFFEQYNGQLYKRIKAKYDPTGRLRGWYERLTKA